MKYERVLSRLKTEGKFLAFPFGTEFTDVELQVGKALKRLKTLMKNKPKFFAFVLRSLFATTGNPAYEPALERMSLSTPRSLKEHLYRKLIVGAIASS